MISRRRRCLLGLGAGLFLGLHTPIARATNINEPTAVLVFPAVLSASTGGGVPTTETFLTITNTSSQNIVARVLFVPGTTCMPCNFTLPLGPLDSEVLGVTRNGAGTSTTFRQMDTGTGRVCTGANGFVVVTVEDPATGTTLGDNVLTGDSVVADYNTGEASSVGAVSISGSLPACRKCLSFDDAEYGKLPAVLGSPFLAPDMVPGVNAKLTLFTLELDAGVVPFVDCQVIGTSASGFQFSNSFQFGCWTQIRLTDISPEYAYPNLGPSPSVHEEQGWIQLQCTVDGADGGVHGMLSQRALTGAVLRRASAGPALASATSWGRLLVESATVGDSVAFCDQGIGIADTDADGLANSCDPCPTDASNDADGDGVCGAVNNCPAVANPTQANADADAFGDACDPCAFDPQNDQDADGLCGNVDNCPAIANPSQANADSDALGDACDSCAFDPLNDIDLDARCGEVDNCPMAANPTQANADGDGYGDACDLCPLVPGSGTADTDHDGLGSACDPDADGDGTPNASDPDDDNDTVLDSDGDGSTDPCTGGNRINCDDNCPFDFNLNQRDRDSDGIGDLCDPTDDLVQGGSASKTTTGPGFVATVTYVFAWEVELGALSYNVYRGTLPQLVIGSYGSCYRNRIRTTYTTLPESPAQGAAFVYLVSPVYSNREGSLGYRSNGTERPITFPCP